LTAPEKVYKRASKSMTDSAGAHAEFARARDAAGEEFDRAAR
jgi:hypothetical protein